jgi:3-oxoacyl-[acyl-carrier-protein] synthase-1
MMLAIQASGMVTAIGFNAPASCAAMRAGIRGAKETGLWDAESGEYVVGGRVALPHWWDSVEKLADLVVPAILECLAAARPVPGRQIPILLGAPPADRPCRPRGLDEALLGEVAYRLGFEPSPASKVLPRGAVSAAVGLLEARRLIDEGGAPCCIVAAVDSLMQQDLAEYYLQRRRLLTAANSNGFSPGEAGTAILVGPAGRAAAGALTVLGVGLAREAAPIETEEPFRGDGLAEAVRAALVEAGLTLDDVAYRVTDLNGEHYKFKEAVFAMTRFDRTPKEVLFDLWHPTEYIGEVGAAIGPCVFGWALHAGQKGYALGPVALCHFSNDDGERAAVIVRYEPEGGRP